MTITQLNVYLVELETGKHMRLPLKVAQSESSN